MANKNLGTARKPSGTSSDGVDVAGCTVHTDRGRNSRAASSCTRPFQKPASTVRVLSSPTEGERSRRSRSTPPSPSRRRSAVKISSTPSSSPRTSMERLTGSSGRANATWVPKLACSSWPKRYSLWPTATSQRHKRRRPACHLGAPSAAHPTGQRDWARLLPDWWSVNSSSTARAPLVTRLDSATSTRRARTPAIRPGMSRPYPQSGQKGGYPPCASGNPLRCALFTTAHLRDIPTHTVESSDQAGHHRTGRQP